MKCIKKTTYSGECCRYILTAEAKLADECKNGVCRFSITGIIRRQSLKGGRPGLYSMGCLHDEIEKNIYEFAPFLKLHLCNRLGQPMYPVQNGIYLLSESTKEVAVRELRLIDGEYEKLRPIALLDDEDYFKYMLYKLGIVRRWKKEADEFIAFLENETGEKWVNPYKGKEKFVLKITRAEVKHVEVLIRQGYYSDENIERRANEKKWADINEEIDKVRKYYDSSIQDLKDEKRIKIGLLSSGIPIDNMIYYEHRRTVKFNWFSGAKKIDRETFDKVLRIANNQTLDIFPSNISFELGDEGREP